MYRYKALPRTNLHNRRHAVHISPIKFARHLVGSYSIVPLGKGRKPNDFVAREEDENETSLQR